MAEKYIIRVTAGSDYDLDQHVVVPVNSHEPVRIDTELIDAELNVRVRNYSGLPRGSPVTSPYFTCEPHTANDDWYSIAIRFTPKRPAARPDSMSVSKDPSGAPPRLERCSGSSQSSSCADSDEDTDEQAASGISGTDLQFGNDFDHPIRDRLPPGFGYAMNIVKWWIDPGLEGDAYADQPYLYGPALSSFNTIHVGPGEICPEKGGLCFGEGGDEDGLRDRHAIGTPEAAKDRMKWALKSDNRSRWLFHYGKTYCLDFYNPYIDFNEFSLRLPGFTLPIMKYWDGQSLRPRPKRSHTLRYVLRNRASNATYLVVVFTLYLKEDVNEDGSLKPTPLTAARQQQQHDDGEATDDLGGAAEVDSGASPDKDNYETRRRFEKIDIGRAARNQETFDDGVD
ncbi:DUF1769-domain-containing protein [Durotheca rogersii]|uniref:DUF1769-domain-containing protein n=1 Tax=Durotheca rogersii TaxID=419775 RepID=UPI00221E59FB|nr:DUF1769-domain-containing protein [Durotheca rogersii]KAI5864951.1 DUF1769-domain-containing protein [Durotheca rogersii]